MYYSSNNNNLDENNIRTSSKMLWFGMQASPLMLAGCILLMENIIKQEAIMPELKTILMSVCILGIPLGFILSSRFRRIEQEIQDNFYATIENPKSLLQRYITFLVFGMMLCEIPAMFGLVLYIMTGEVYLSLFFIVCSFALGFLYKPELQH